MTENVMPPPGREPVEAPPIAATFHINNTQGIVVPDSLFPDGKPPAAPPVEEAHLDVYSRGS